MNESKVLVLFTVILSPSTINREYTYYYKSTKDIFRLITKNMFHSFNDKTVTF